MLVEQFFVRYAELERLLTRDGYHQAKHEDVFQLLEGFGFVAVLERISLSHEVSEETRSLARELAGAVESQRRATK